MVLHIFPDEKFTFDYIKRINILYDNSEHLFCIYHTSYNLCSEDMFKEYSNVYFTYSFSEETFKKSFSEAERVICHSILYNTKDIGILYRLQKKYNRKMVWALWGADLYNEYRRNHNSIDPRLILKEHYRKKLISSFYKVLSSSDFQQMKSWYKTNAVQGKGLYSYDFKPIEKVETNNSGRRNIMVGHSATETCCHIQAFEILKDYKDIIEIYCPLSYPKIPEYIKQVDDSGIKLYGKNYHPLKDFMNFSDYSVFLNTIDIGVFNNDRQQGMGNIVNLLYLGKKVYMNKKNTLYNVLKEEGFILFNVDDIVDATFLEDLTEDQKINNRKLVEYRYSDENFKNVWNKVFYD